MIISYIAVPANIEITTEPKTKAILIPEKKNNTLNLIFLKMPKN